MSQRSGHILAALGKAEYLLSLSILSCLLMFFENCHVIDDDSINAVCTADCTIMQGRFTTPDGNTPIPNMRLDLDWSESRGGLPAFLRYTRKVATTQTDENGN